MREETDNISSYTMQPNMKYNCVSVYMLKTFQE